MSKYLFNTCQEKLTPCPLSLKEREGVWTSCVNILLLILVRKNSPAAPSLNLICPMGTFSLPHPPFGHLLLKKEKGSGILYYLEKGSGIFSFWKERGVTRGGVNEQCQNIFLNTTIVFSTTKFCNDESFIS